jgi:hypothetical protein
VGVSRQLGLPLSSQVSRACVSVRLKLRNEIFELCDTCFSFGLLEMPAEMECLAFLLLAVLLAVLSWRRKAEPPFADDQAQLRMRERQKAEAATATARALVGYNLGSSRKSLLLDHMLRQCRASAQPERSMNKK